MAKELKEKVLMKIDKGINLTEEESEVIIELESKGLVRFSEDEVELTPYGRIISVLGYQSVKRAEQMEKGLSEFSLEDYDTSKTILITLFAVILFVLLLIFWVYFEDLFYL